MSTDTPYLIVPVAPPGAGKSTLVGTLFGQGLITADAVVCPDEVRVWLTGDGSDQTANRSVFEITDTIIRNRLSRGLDVFMDATNLRPSDQGELVVMAARNNVPILWVEFGENIAALAEQRNRERTEGRVPDDVMRVMFERYAQVDWVALSRLGRVCTVASVAEILAARG